MRKTGMDRIWKKFRSIPGAILTFTRTQANTTLRRTTSFPREVRTAMKLAIGTQPPPARNGAMGFTLIELILVMALFVVVMGIVAPDLSSFFRGRNLDSEAQRFLSLTRYGRSRAISEGVPVELWINAKQGHYGLQAVSGYTETKGNAVDYPVSEN